FLRDELTAASIAAKLSTMRAGQHMLVSSSTVGRHTSSFQYNWPLLKSDRLSLPERIYLT
ncbi:MAG: hypothetical protein ACYCU8_11605, partial [Ferrimicrobium acidiphilum]